MSELVVSFLAKWNDLEVQVLQNLKAVKDLIKSNSAQKEVENAKS